MYGGVSRARSVDFGEYDKIAVLNIRQRESTASIKNTPQIYSQTSPPRAQAIIEIDCRGLEFVEFKSDVFP